MKKLLFVSLISACAIVAKADTFTFTPSPSDLSDLDHTHAYVWGISNSTLRTQSQVGSGWVITSATLTITNIYNWDKLDTNNNLFINLLDNPLINTGANGTGVLTPVDDAADQGINQGVISNYFTDGGYTRIASYLASFHDNDGPDTHNNLTFNITGSNLTLLTSYIRTATTNGADFGIGFDPDCHYYNDGICLTITTAKVPDGSMTLVLLGLGLTALSGARRYFRRS